MDNINTKLTYIEQQVNPETHCLGNNPPQERPVDLSIILEDTHKVFGKGIAERKAEQVEVRKHPFFSGDDAGLEHYKGFFDLAATLSELNRLVEDGKRLSFVIGRGNKEKSCEDHGTSWVYCDISGRSMDPQLKEKPHLWLNFDQVEHLRLLAEQLEGKVSMIVFDYSVINHFGNFKSCGLPVFHRLLSPEGKLYIPVCFGVWYPSIDNYEDEVPSIQNQDPFGSILLPLKYLLDYNNPSFDYLLESKGYLFPNENDMLEDVYERESNPGPYFEWSIGYLKNTGLFSEEEIEGFKTSWIASHNFWKSINEEVRNAQKGALEAYFTQQGVQMLRDDQYPISGTFENTVGVNEYFLATKQCI